jgi:uncharacterized protein YdeI (YjbR/CyaY-like superfamily)
MDKDMNKDMNKEIHIPDNLKKYPIEVQESVSTYLNQLNEKERKAYFIAYSHLGSSFNILKSIGYIGWKNKRELC